ncbi:hypothetical protein NAL32_13290 [Chryseobacterium sp. Ch-15]|uniref:Uncharacterized protein n=1 Tax=Chryseobacterium muglaense TaxID=2893752 RepID=A0A9Q3UZZ9_9FLAO|nr:hypothetical protein [Chryseobacterium muglaense]MBD3905493.1 hypothetical protein [Chryseobacterium muglaense]MCC9036434.1 hypothetical protein [Chryseobacterium muglaense]MCM2555359.1 hypothetical protein [Chryseobacterium muglaense]
MKNYFNSILLAVTLIFFSCQNSNQELSNQCDECETADYVLKDLKIGKSSFSMRDYNIGTINDPDFFTINASEVKISEIIKFLSGKSFAKKTKALVLFSNNSNQIDNLISEDIDAFMIYEQNNNGTYNVRLFNKIQKEYIENKVSNLESNIISSNDFKNISLLINDDMYKKTLAIIDIHKLINTPPQKLELQNVLSQNKLLQAKGGSYCNFPCNPPGADAWCTVQESQMGNENWFCLADPRPCAADHSLSLATEQTESIQQYRSANTRDFLHYFRNDYLSKFSNGYRYIEIYYNLSEKMEYSKINMNFINETFILINDMRPKLESLIANANSQDIIMIDNNTANKLTTYLIKYSHLFSDENSLNEIKFLISKIDQFTNKNNHYVTNNL